MAILLDYRSSQNSNTSPGVPGTQIGAAPVFIGDIGLIVGSATNIRVNLWATIGINNTSQSLTTLTLHLARNLSPTNIFIPANVIFTATELFESGFDQERFVTINAADLNPTPGPIAGQINYSFFAVVTSGSPLDRNGPENLTGMAVTG